MPWKGPDPDGDQFPTLGHMMAEWCAENLVIPDGPRRGEPFVLTDEQYVHMMQQYRLNPNATAVMGSRAFRYYGSLLVRPQKSGKDPLAGADACFNALGPARFDGWDANGDPVGAPVPTPWIQCAANSEEQPLALDTEVPTPTGWTTVGELQVGDLVFSSTGEPVRVARRTPVFWDKTCYQVTFDDGEQIVATAGHGWVMDRRTGNGNRAERVSVTTEQMAADYRRPSNSRQGWGSRYRVESASFELPDIELPLHPYLLGLWLGDGSKSDSMIATNVGDHEELRSIIEPLLDEHERIVFHRVRNQTGHLRIRAISRRHRSMRERLRDAGVLGHKHIPQRYLRAGTGQRRALLQGLIDSDGHIDAKGRVGFTNVDLELIEGIEELVTTLGYKLFTQKTNNGAFRVFFTAGDGQPAARLSRKASRQKPWTARSTSRWHYITDIRQVASVPTRCIGIDTEDHLFLVGRSAIPTKNTSNTFRMIYGMLGEGPISNTPGLDVGLTRVTLPDNGRIEPVTANARSRLGQRITYCVMTESGLFTETSGGVAMARTIKRGLAGMDGRWIEITNAWDPSEDSTAQRTFQAEAPGVYINYRPPRAHIDLDDDQALRTELLYVYGDAAIERGGWVNIERIMDEIRDPATGEGEGRRFFLNEIWVGSKDAIDSLKWAAQADPGDPLKPTERICLGFHGSQTQDATSLVACRLRDGKLFHLRTWQKPEGVSKWSVPRPEVLQAVSDAFEAYEVLVMFCAPATWQTEVNQWAGEYNEPGDHKVLELWLNSEMRVDQMIERFQTAHRGGGLRHDGDEVLTEHAKAAALANGRKRSSAEEKDSNLPEHYQRVIRKSWGMSISAFVAALLAYEARGWAIEHGALVEEDGPPNLW